MIARNAGGVCTIAASAKSKRAKICHGEILGELGVIAMCITCGLAQENVDSSVI